MRHPTANNDQKSLIWLRLCTALSTITAAARVRTNSCETSATAVSVNPGRRPKDAAALARTTLAKPRAHQRWCLLISYRDSIRLKVLADAWGCKFGLLKYHGGSQESSACTNLRIFI